MGLSAQIQPGQLAVEPAAVAVVMAPGELAVVRARVELRLSPKPMKGAVEVASGDPAFSIVEVRQVRRAERWVTLEVTGACDALEPRAVTLTYSVDGRETTQTVTFAPAIVAPAATAASSAVPASADPPAAAQEPTPEPAPRRYVPFEDEEDRASTEWRVDDAPGATHQAATAEEWSPGIEIASPAMRIGAAFAELVAAVLVMSAIGFAVMVATAGPVVAICGEESTPGTGCATTDAIVVNTATVYILVAIPLYHAVTSMFGRGVAYRLLGLRIVCRGAWLLRPVRENLDHVRPGFLRGLLRTIVFCLGALCFALGHLWIFTNPQRRGWHDLAAGTMVVRDRR